MKIKICPHDKFRKVNQGPIQDGDRMYEADVMMCAYCGELEIRENKQRKATK